MVLVFSLQDTADLLKREAKVKADLLQINDAQSQQVESQATNLLSSYKSEGDAGSYEKAYLSYQRFVESALDVYKVLLHEIRIFKIFH